MTNQLKEALSNIDWEQVVANGGPPCFFMESGHFCLRAGRWGGHDILHPYVSLEDFVMSLEAAK